jgi:hypothetical protein
MKVSYKAGLLSARAVLIVETPIPKAKRSGIGKLNNPAQLAAESVSKACFGVHTRDYSFSHQKQCLIKYQSRDLESPGSSRGRNAL